MPQITTTRQFQFSKTQVSRFSLVVLVILINLLVLINSIFHSPFRGYDSDSHILNIQIYPFRFPTPEESQEFFSAPLPYFIPSLTNKVCLEFSEDQHSCIKMALKTGQIINFLLAVGISILLWKITNKVSPGNLAAKWVVFLNFGILTVFYKSFSQVRGEPYVAFFTIFLIYQLIKTLFDFWNESVKYRDAFLIGLVLGLGMLSRQWFFFLIPALVITFVIVIIIKPSIRPKLWSFLLISSISALLIGGWFYLLLQLKYGSITAFNLESPGFSLTNMPNSFYRYTGLGKLLLFKNPVRPTFDFTFFPILYSDTWGDYWAYFSVNLDNSNAAALRSYLGLVNFVCIIPSLLLLISFFGILIDFIKRIRQRMCTPVSLIKLLLPLMVLFTMAGFLWFVISYPEITNGDTVKATYVLQALIVLPLISGLFYGNLLQKKKGLFTIYTIFYFIVFLLSMRAYLTSYIFPLS